MNKTTYMKRALITALCGMGLWAGSAAAHGYGDGYREWDSARAAHYDRKGDRIERRLDRRAEMLRREGRYAAAARLERKGELINRKLDRKARRVERRYDQQHAYRDYRHDYRHDYRRDQRHRVDPEIALVFELGRWVIRP